MLPCRNQQSSQVQHEHSPSSDKVHQHDCVELCLHNEKTIKDEHLRHHNHHHLYDANKGPASNSVRQAEERSAETQQKKKRCASQTDEGTAVCQEAAGSMQTVSEAISSVGCKVRKRQRPDNKAKDSGKS